MMIGIESEEPGKHGQTGHVHDKSGSSEEFTAVGVRKWAQSDKDRGKGIYDFGVETDVSGKYNVLLVDLIGNGDYSCIRNVMSKGFDKDDLVNPPNTLTPLTTRVVKSAIPSWSE